MHLGKDRKDIHPSPAATPVEGATKLVLKINTPHKPRPNSTNCNRSYPWILGLTNPWSTTVHMEPYSTSAFKGYWIPPSNTNVPPRVYEEWCQEVPQKRTPPTKHSPHPFLSFEYLLLPPRSAARSVPAILTDENLHKKPRAFLLGNLYLWELNNKLPFSRLPVEYRKLL